MTPLEVIAEQARELQQLRALRWQALAIGLGLGIAIGWTLRWWP